MQEENKSSTQAVQKHGVSQDYKTQWCTAEEDDNMNDHSMSKDTIFTKLSQDIVDTSYQQDEEHELLKVNDRERIIQQVVDGLLTDEAELIVEDLLDLDLGGKWHRLMRAVFDDSGICKNVVEAMKENIESVTMLKKCCSLLNSLTYQHEQNTVAFHWAGAADVVVLAMHKFPRCASMQRRGCAALHNLSCVAKYQKNVVHAGGLDALIMAMKAFPRHGQIQLSACRALHKLALFSASIQKQITESGAIVQIALAQSRARGVSDEMVAAATAALETLFRNRTSSSV